MKKATPFVPKILFRNSVWINAARPANRGHIAGISRLTRLCVSDLRQMVRVSLPLILQSSRQKKNKLRYTFDVAWQHHVLIDVSRVG